MSPATVFSIAIRFIALGLGISAITSISFLGAMIDKYLRPDFASSAPWGVISLCLYIVLSMVVAIILYRAADRIAFSAYGSVHPTSSPSSMNPREWLLLAVRVLGIICIILSLPQLLGQGIFRKTIMMNPLQAALTHVLPGLIQMVIGLIFIRKTDAVAGLVLCENRTPQD